jgi:hypothetical protein
MAAGPSAMYRPSGGGAVGRARLPLAAVCRSRNAGGTASDMVRIFGVFVASTELVDSPVPLLGHPAGLSLVAATSGCEVEAIWKSDDDQFVRVVDGRFTEVISQDDQPALIPQWGEREEGT